MQKIRKRIDMYQVVVPPETARALLIDRYAKVKSGPVFCKECGKFFDWKADNICDLDKCSRHRNKIGFRLLDIL
jgi:hypothetical protein